MCSAHAFSEKIHVDLSGVPQTMLGTLYGRARDADADKPILGDTFAKEVVNRLDYDWSKTGLSAKQAALLALRPAHFDDWARQFLAVNDRAVVLHLGCGLDGRVFRLNPGPGVEWYDVDYPNVIALCEQIYPHRKHHQLVPASVTEPAWLQTVPPDRPVLMIAEGLVMYLTEHDGVALLRRIVDRFPSGELQFDVFNWLGVKGQKANPVIRRSGSTLRWAINGPDDIMHAVPGLRLLAALPAGESDTYRRAFGQGSAVNRLLGRVAARIPAVRGISQYHRYAF
jgi:O-methyltransferase involved in polyketide biosynthesis